MKTNHRRGYVEEGKLMGTRYRGQTKKLPVGLGSISAHTEGGDFTNGNRGEARNKRGAKKFLNNQVRKTEAKHIEMSLEET